MIIQACKQLVSKLLMRLPTKPYLYLVFYIITKQRLSLKNPQRFSHKLQWLKLYGHLEQYELLCDKYTVRDYVAKKIGAQYLIPFIGVWDDVDAIPFDTLPKSYVLKLTTGTGFNFICKDKAMVDLEAGKAMLRRGLGEDFYSYEREPQYLNHVPRIIGEAYMEDETGQLRDFKIHCEKGVPKMIQVDVDRFTNHRSIFYDLQWNKIDYLTPAEFADDGATIERPAEFTKLLQVARTLSEEFPYVRVDLYIVKGKIYFGELTFTPGSGFVSVDERADVEMGKMINLAAY